MYIRLHIQEESPFNGISGSKPLVAEIWIDDYSMFTKRDRKRRVKYTTRSLIEHLMRSEDYGE